MIQKLMQDFLLLLATIDPIGTLAVFAAITSHMTDAQRRRTAAKATLYASSVLLGAVVIGQIVLSSLGIKLISLQVAGGIILFLFGLQMLFGKSFKESPAHGEEGHDIAVFPLAVPCIASPGAIMAAIISTDNSLHSIPTQALTALLMLLVLALTYGFMILAKPIFKILGKNGASILVRVMGIVLAALSVELVMKALRVQPWLAVGP